MRDYSGKNNPFYGKRHSDEAKLKVSKANKGRKGRPMSNSHKAIISKTHKNKIVSSETRRKLSKAKLGKSNTKESKIKVSKKLKGRVFSTEHIDRLSGENHWNWKGGISSEEYCPAFYDKEYKESIKRRDNYQCQSRDCSGRSIILTVHHINYDKKDCSPRNLITLCRSCNCKANFNREFWQEYYEEMMRCKEEKD